MPRSRLVLAAAVLAVLCLQSAVAHAAISDIADDPTWTIGQQPVEAFAPDGDRVWVGGNFARAAPRTGPGAGIDLSGNRIPGYSELTDAVGALVVDAVTGDGSGGWFVAGTFTKAGGVTRPGLVHLKADGSVDAAFNAQATAGTIRALALSGGLLYVGGSFTTIAGAAHTGLAALNPATGADAGWIANVVGGTVNALAIQGGFAWVGGSFTQIGGNPAARAAKVPIGVGGFSADPVYQPNPNLQVRAVLATATDVYLGGDFATVAGVTSGATSRVSKTNPTTGAPDGAWSPSVTGLNVTGLATDGTILYAAGNFTSFGGAARNGTAATPLSAVGGGVATGWYPGDLNQGGTPTSIAVAGGNVYIGGNFEAIGGGTRTGLAASPANATGGLTSWDPETTEGVRAVAANGSAVYAGGSFSGVGAVGRQSLMALDLLTGAALPFSHTFDDDVHTVTVCGDTVYVGGVFFTVDGQARLDAAAFDRNTGALLPWDPAPDGDVWSIACGNGVVYLGGQFLFLAFGTPQQVARGGLAAVDPVTGAYTSWDPVGAGPGAFVNSLIVDGSTVYAGGSFSLLNGVTRNNIAAINATTGAPTSWDPNVTGTIQSMASTGSTLYVAGSITAVGVSARTRMAEIRLSDGTPTAFDPQPDNAVRSIARAPDGTLYAGGLFTQVGGAPHRGVAAIRPDGTVTGWNPQLQGDVTGLAAGGDGRIYLGGNFTGAASRGLLGIATFSEPTSFATQPALTSAPVEGQSVTCDPGTHGGSLPAPQTIQWQLDGADIAGATTTTYTPATSDVGHALSCRVSQRNLNSTAQADSASMSVAAAQVQQPPPPPFDIDGFATPPPPVKGKSVIATPTQGTVLVKLPTFRQFIPLPDAERIPVGTIVDATRGTVKITTVGAGGKVQTASFYGGVFQIFQSKGAKPMVELRLVGGNFTVCPRVSRTRSRRASLTKVAKTKSIRHLWGNGKGLFRTKGKYASATIRGTKWLTDDRCDGTLVRVTKGAVTVRDFPKKTSLVLKAPKKYLARR